MAGRQKARNHGGGVPDVWRQIAEAEKTSLAWPTWRDPPPQPGHSQAGTRRDELHSAAAETTDFVTPLADANGRGLEGVRLRVVAWAYKRLTEVTATLEVPGGRSFVTIARVDAWPVDPHINSARKKLPKWRHVPSMIEGHHVHRFADNAALGQSAFEPERNLPIAMPVAGDLRSFRDFLRTVSEEFRIDGLADISAPDSWRLLI